MKIKSELNKIERAVKFELIEPKLNSPIKCVTKNKSRQAIQHRQKDIRLGFVGSGDVWRWVKEQKRKKERKTKISNTLLNINHLDSAPQCIA